MRSHAPQVAFQDDDLRTVAVPMRPLAHGALRTVFLDLVGRPPFAAEHAEWHGRGFLELVPHLVGSAEFWNHWWEEQLYYFLLVDTFRPVTEAARAVPTGLAEGRLSARDAIHRLALTSSFDLRNPGADTFVTVVMEQVCGITVQDRKRDLELGKKAYDGGEVRLFGDDAASQADVVRVCIEHEDAAAHLVRREYERIVKRAPERAALRDSTRRLHRDPHAFVELVGEWMLSDAYRARLAESVALPNRTFVRALYVDLLDRLPTEDEAEPMRYALDGLADSRPLRSLLARLLIDSGDAPLPSEGSIEDPRAWIAGLFHRWLGRDPSSAELETFETTLALPECSPSTVAYALLTSAEYHRY